MGRIYLLLFIFLSCWIGQVNAGAFCRATTDCKWNEVCISLQCQKIVCSSGNVGSAITYTGQDGACTCASGNVGLVVYILGLPHGCNPCSSGSWAPPGNNNVCTPIDCTKTIVGGLQAYTGTGDTGCACAQGFGFANGTSAVTFVAGAPSGCNAIPCFQVGYTGLPSKCVCDAGYIATGNPAMVIYNNDGTLSGCAPCPFFYWSVAATWTALGMLQSPCTAVPCNAFSNAYQGTPPNCTCSSTFFGYPTYANGIYNYCNSCRKGTWAPAGVGQTCATIDVTTVDYTKACNVDSDCSALNEFCFNKNCAKTPCTSFLGYVGNPGNCQCSVGWEGTVVYKQGSMSGCKPCSDHGIGYWAPQGNNQVCSLVPCNSNSNAFTGITPSCTCSPGYNGWADFVNGEWSYCEPCDAGYWAPVGNGNLCTAVPVTSVSNIPCVTHSDCPSVNNICFNSTSLDIHGTQTSWSMKCTGIPCNSFPGYVGDAGNCKCDAGYEGTVTYPYHGMLNGCTSCYLDGIGFWTQMETGNNSTCSL